MAAQLEEIDPPLEGVRVAHPRHSRGVARRLWLDDRRRSRTAHIRAPGRSRRISFAATAASSSPISRSTATRTASCPGIAAPPTGSSPCGRCRTSTPAAATLDGDLLGPVLSADCRRPARAGRRRHRGPRPRLGQRTRPRRRRSDRSAWVGSCRRRAPESFVAPIGATTERDCQRSTRARRTDVSRRRRTHARRATSRSSSLADAADCRARLSRRARPRDARLAACCSSFRARSCSPTRARCSQRQLLLGAGGLVLLIAAISLVAASISRPIHALAVAVGAASDDDLDFHLPEVARRDEVGVLTEALRRMRTRCSATSSCARRDLAARARLEHELEIAASIQQSMLPRRTRGCAASRCTSRGRSVAGEASRRRSLRLLREPRRRPAVRDRRRLGQGHSRGAVHGESVGRCSRCSAPPASCRTGCSPRSTQRFADSNDACMFVTSAAASWTSARGCYGTRAPATSRRWCSRSAATSSRCSRRTARDRSRSRRDYPLSERYVAPGDTLVLFTDGVTEAEAADGSLFGLERVSALLRERAPDERSRRARAPHRRCRRRPRTELSRDRRPDRPRGRRCAPRGVTASRRDGR